LTKDFHVCLLVYRVCRESITTGISCILPLA
jgi:hypothetical protein